ncbi:MAG: hypothetical protein E7369_05945, partial [Clostridiales bacterium]|nr:hypothetical protein [Clostridiales bacterium]
AKYVGADCMRYKLDPPDFKHIDIVEIYKGINKQKDAVGLTKMCELLGVEKSENAHCALDDAIMTMQCAKALCVKEDLPLKKLVEKYPRSKGEIKDYKSEYLRKKTYKRFIKECENAGMTLTTREQERTLNAFRRTVKPTVIRKHTPLSYKRVCISYNYECFHYYNTLKLVQLICNMGGKSIGKSKKADIFVTYDVNYGDGLLYCSRKEQAELAQKEGKKIRFITFKTLLSILGITERGLDNMLPIDESKIIRPTKPTEIVAQDPALDHSNAKKIVSGVKPAKVAE